MKKTFFILFFSVFCFLVRAQEDVEPLNVEPLRKQLQLGVGIQGVDLTFQYPLSNNYLLSIGAGGGVKTYVLDRSSEDFIVGGRVLDSSSPLVVVPYISPFSKVSVRYIYNREKLGKKRVTMSNNRGGYLSFQNKFSFGTGYGIMMINKVNWGGNCL